MAEATDNTDSESARPLWLGWRILGIVLLSYFGLVLLLKFLENRFVYFPSPWPSDQDIVLPDYMHDVHFDTASGVSLHGWHLSHLKPRAHVLFLHGNAGNLVGRKMMLERLHDTHGLDVFAFDYRGYGKSAGRPTEAANISDARRARHVYAEMAGISESEVVLMGRSLGGAIAVTLAAEDGARGLVLQSTFTSLPDMAARQFPWLPVRMMMKNRYPSIDRLPDYHGPLLYSHSEDDTIIPYAMGQALFSVANEPKEFFRMSGRGHNDPQSPEYDSALIDFLDSLP
jgi:fermentation-respiration switch protein FrsA (DUF1100 family)